jgi:hypothetical protein
LEALAAFGFFASISCRICRERLSRAAYSRAE